MYSNYSRARDFLLVDKDSLEDIRAKGNRENGSVIESSGCLISSPWLEDIAKEVRESREGEGAKHVPIALNPAERVGSENPKVWGPPLWYSIHNGAMSYPERASKITRERMKGYIVGLPVTLPCEECRDHANAYVEKHYNNLDLLCSGRENLFNWFVDFHNYVNMRHGKEVWSYERAWNHYSR